MKLIAGNSNLPLAESIASLLKIPLSRANVGAFNDKETFCEILDPIRGQDVFIIQSTSRPANNTLMEALLLLDALKRASAKTLTVVMPYFGYGRQDRKSSPRTPITAKLVANLLTVAGATRIVTMDLHAAQIQGFFDIPVDNLFAVPVFTKYINENDKPDNLMIVSPDVGGVTRSRALASRLGCDMAVIDKRRPKPGEAKVMNIIGDVRGKHCILIDDIVDTAGTLCHAAEALKASGAESVQVYVTHAVLSDPALERIENSVLEKVFITNSILTPQKALENSKITVIDIAPILAEAIQRIHECRSVSSLF